eukprot:CAMPEP_0197297476 /NCGR_PEP_ID=MMETSP0890-20130614/41114_1 /TAXON_ID=44058 ORGANISM="Aureoumbra lagunensis, Strain CCMP1510" /NCGR_SAMPLE_ID=MMETSP0890 /ASSEMBLY_ACC=CAM_ASM_000533 /LENGTH=417 /DNA_ID=CAMNT_0042774633 /DNA_START=118 /DNA_END=1371 /DNA_ORIENTATION=-
MSQRSIPSSYFSSGEKKDEPQFAKMKLRKTGIDVKEGVGEDDASNWWSFKWFDSLCTGLCQPMGESILEAPQRQRISVVRIRCCACGETIFNPQLESYTFRGAKYHKKCVACKACARSLASDSLLKYVKNGELLCQVCVVKIESEERRSSIGHHVIGATQEEAGKRKEAEHKGDVKGVLNTIGDDLEETFRQVVPRCEICGATFNMNSDNIHYVIERDKRIPKYHQECLDLGRPRDGTVHSAQPPRIAIKQAPLQLVLKIILDPPNGKAVTIFFEKKKKILAPDAVSKEKKDEKYHTKAENQAPASVEYIPAISASESNQAAAFLKRRETLIATALNASSVSFTIPADPAFIMTQEEGDSSSLRRTKIILLEAIKNRLLHLLRFEFQLSPDGHTASPKSASLSISIPPTTTTATAQK